MENPSSKPIKKTTGNSSPLAACNVIKVTCEELSSKLSKSETKAKSVKNPLILFLRHLDRRYFALQNVYQILVSQIKFVQVF